MTREATTVTARLRASRSLVAGALAAMLVLLVRTNVAFAGPSSPPEIVKVEVNYDTQTIIVSGHNFGTTQGRAVMAGSSGSVDVELVVAGWTNERVVAYLPNNQATETYRLAIITSGFKSSS